MSALYPIIESSMLIREPSKTELDFLCMSGRSRYWEQGFKGKGLKAAIIDTGVNKEHPEFEGKLVQTYANVPYISEGKDDNGHGTHCAALLVGKTVGIAPEADLVSYKILDNFGSLNKISQLLWALKEIAKRNDISVVSMSIGLPESRFSESELIMFYDLIDTLNKKGCYVVCSAGNQGVNSEPRYPAYFDNPLVVGAVDEHMQPSWFSSVHDQVDICQVGFDVCSAWYRPVNNTYYYRIMSGTSQATPIAAGLVLLLCEKYYKMNDCYVVPFNIRDMIHCLSIDLGVSGVDNKTGIGFFTLKDSISHLKFDIDIQNILDIDIHPGTVIYNEVATEIEARPIMMRDTDTGNWKAMCELRSLFELLGSKVVYHDGIIDIWR